MREKKIYCDREFFLALREILYSIDFENLEVFYTNKEKEKINEFKKQRTVYKNSDKNL